MHIVCCKPTKVEADELVGYIKKGENGLIQTTEQQGYKLSVYYKPTDLIISQQLNNREKKEIDSLKRALEPYQYFIFSVLKQGEDLETGWAKQRVSFADKLSYLNLGFSTEIKLVVDQETVELQDYLYLRSYGSNASDFLLVFKNTKKKDLEIRINGHALGFGAASFSFKQTDIDKVPQLIF